LAGKTGAPSIFLVFLSGQCPLGLNSEKQINDNLRFFSGIARMEFNDDNVLTAKASIGSMGLVLNAQ
jgi:hypothetical protein